MSWSRRRVCRAGTGALAVVGLGSAAGCGFQPLYSQPEADTTVSTDLAAVRIEPLRDRVGQRMHNFLRDRLNPQGQPVAPSYRLQVELSETLSELGVRRDETATRANLRMEASFALRTYGGDQPLFAGRATSTTSYDILDNPFATTVSEGDARERALRELADDIQTRLAVYFANS